MTWGYLSEFWGAITAVGDYTVEWFQSVGNAVAGAIGGYFEGLTHHIYDVFYSIEWFLDNLKDMFEIAFTPLTWIFNFVRGFFSSATASLESLGITVPEIDLMTDNVQAVFDAIPYFSLLMTGIGGALGIFFLIIIIKKIIHI